MMTELAMLAWGCVLALVHILATAQARTRQYGTKWNVGARDEDLPPPSRWSAGSIAPRPISSRPSP